MKKILGIFGLLAICLVSVSQEIQHEAVAINIEVPVRVIKGDVFSSFSEIAKTTGGVVLASANAGAAFKQASDASENYYLLYYTPRRYRADNVFKNIKVRVKGQKYKVLHRAGYIAD